MGEMEDRISSTDGMIKNGKMKKRGKIRK